MNEQVSILSICVMENEILSKISIPSLHVDVDLRVFKEDSNDYFLVAIPELAWCCKVKEHTNLKESKEEQIYPGTFYSIGDIKFLIPGIEVHKKELYLIFAYMTGLVAKNSYIKTNNYLKQINEIHVEHCEKKLKKENILNSKVQWVNEVKNLELSCM